MDQVTFKFWVEHSARIEKERDMWIGVAKRLVNPLHDANCQYGARCSYCDAVQKVAECR